MVDAGAPPGFRTPPHSIEAEQALLGAILISNDAYYRVANVLRPEHFHEPVHGRIYGLIQRLSKSGRPASPITLSAAFRDDPDLRELNGPEYLAKLARSAEIILNPEDYAAHVVELAGKRALIELCTGIVDEAHDLRDGRELHKLQERVVQGLDQITREVKLETGPLDGVIDPADWQGKPVPERKWVVENWIPRSYVTSLYGDGATGKSTLIQQLGTCLAVGRSWLGLPTIEGRALIVFCEDDDDELHRRQEAINRHYGTDYTDLRGKLRLVERVGRDNLLMAFATGDVGHLTPFFAQLEAECQKFDPDLIALDPVADLFGGQESNRVHVRRFIQGCFGKLIRGCPRRATGVLLAHPSQTGMASGGYSGNTDWNNSVRARLYLQRATSEKDEAPDEDVRTLSRRKSNYARQGDQLSLRWRDGVFMLDDKVHAMDLGYLGHLERDRCEAVYLELLGTIIDQGRYLSPSRNSQNYGPALLAKSPDRAGFKRRDFELAQERLFRDGRLTLGVHTTANRKQYDCIVPKGVQDD